MRFLALFGILSTLVAASPTPVHVPQAKKTCVVPFANGGDDTPAAQWAAGNCSSNAVIEFAEGIDYNILTPVALQNLTNVEIRVRGNLHLPTNMTVVRDIVSIDAGLMLTGMRWFSFGGTNVKYVGTNNVTGGWIEGYGQQYWDANPVNGSGIDNRPKLILWELQDSSIQYLKVRKPPAWVSTLSGNNIKVSDVFIDASTYDGGGFPFNTDGFDITATNVNINHMTILNGDDAIAINNGAENVTVQDVFMGGPGCHGLSIGSLGKNNSEWQSVKNIHFKDVTAVGSVYGARFKSYSGGQGLVENVTWENFHIQNVTYPIFVTQTYYNQGSTQTQNGVSVSSGNSSQAVNMKNFTWKNWRGSINTYQPGDGSCASVPCWYALAGADGTQAVAMTCATDSSCQNFKIEDVEIIPQSYAQPTVICTGVGADSNPDFGITCGNGTAFIPL